MVAHGLLLFFLRLMILHGVTAEYSDSFVATSKNVFTDGVDEPDRLLSENDICTLNTEQDRLKLKVLADAVNLVIEISFHVFLFGAQHHHEI